jgi:hypothetical protein
LMIVRSVFRFGIVHVSVTWFPARVADRSPTASGRFKEGGCGAPGVPHAASRAHRPNPSTAQHLRPSEIIAVSLMDTATNPPSANIAETSVPTYALLNESTARGLQPYRC